LNITDSAVGAGGMAEYDLVAKYIDVAQRATRMGDLEAETEAAIRELGFDYFAILHHLDLECPGALPGDGQVRFSNYPTAFREAVQQQRLVGIDPVLRASQRTAHGFLWSEVPGMIELTPKQREIISLGARMGLGDGYTVPVHVPGEYLGSSSFGLKWGRDVRRQSLPMLHYLGSFAFEAGRRIAMQKANVQRTSNPPLSDRQLDCVVLAGRGQPARKAAKTLGIKQDTFQKHIQEAKQRVGVRSTTQLVVRTLFDGRIAFRDLLKEKQRSS
jgi:LuxR family transcriptional regulator, quorum-sensing system regulator CciR